MSSSSSLCHVRRLTCASRVSPQPSDLIEWVRKQGGFVNPAVSLTNRPPCGFGLTASKHIPNGSDLISLPHHLPLSFGSVLSDGQDLSLPFLVELGSHIPQELWAMRLGLKLLSERAKSGSFWWPYISNLPETYSVPIFFPGDDIKNLQYAPVLYQVNKRCRFLLEFEKRIKNALSTLKSEDHPFGGQDIDASSLGWAMSAVSSRAFRLHGEELPAGEISNVPMMLPLIDMCNHSFTPNAKIIQEKGSGNQKMLVKVIAEAEIKQDEPLALNYGCLNNDFLLLDYGFVVPSNPYETIELKYDGAFLDAASMAAGVTSPNFSSPSPWQQQILAQLNLGGNAPDLKVSIGGPDLVEGRLLAALRVLLSTDENTVQKHDLENLLSLSTEAPLGIPNEINALRTIVALCVIALGHFPTKIMEDESILKQEISDSTRLAVEFRMQKKCVIVDVMRDLTRRVKKISSKESANAQG